MDHSRRPADKLDLPHSDPPQQPQDDRPTAQDETPESGPGTDHRIVKDITAEPSPAEENEAADGPKEFDRPPQDPAAPSAGTDVDQGPLEIADVAPPSDTVELGAQVVDEPEGPPLRLLAESDEPLDSASATAQQSREADMSPRTQGLLSLTSDGGPPLARPMVLVNLPDAQTARIKEQLLAAAAARDEATLDKIAEAKVDHAFWVRACHERAVWGNY